MVELLGPPWKLVEHQPLIITSFNIFDYNPFPTDRISCNRLPLPQQNKKVANPLSPFPIFSEGSTFPKNPKLRFLNDSGRMSENYFEGSNFSKNLKSSLIVPNF